MTRDETDHIFEGQKVMFLTGMNGAVDGLRVSVDPSIDDPVFKRRSDVELCDPKYLARFEGAYMLLPKRHDTFDLKGLNGYSVRFKSETGSVTGCEFVQPEGVFAAARVK